MPERSAAYAAVDLGATSGRVVVGRLGNGLVTTTEVARFANRPVTVPHGNGTRLSWDVLGLWAEIREGLRIAARDHGPLRSVGIDTWGVDHALLDRREGLLDAPVHYRDTRTHGMPDRFFAAMSAADLHAATGLQTQEFNTVFQLLAAHEDGLLDHAHRILMMPDLLAYWLTGRHVTEITNASTTGMLDPSTRDWSTPVLDTLHRLTTCDIRKLLAPLVVPGEVIGPVAAPGTKDLAMSGTVVTAVGSHDTASAVAATPLDGPGDAYLSSGTWSLLGAELPVPLLSPQARTANFTNELGVNGTVRFLRNVSGLWLLSEAMRAWQAAGFSTDLVGLLSAASEQPPLRTVVDVNDPGLARPGHLPARIVEAARRTGQPTPDTPAAVVRCILDSLALAYRLAVRDLASLTGHEIDTIHVVGGGVHNTLLLQLTADATRRQVLAGPAEATVLGNLLYQAATHGSVVGGEDEIRTIVRRCFPGTRYRPTGSESVWAGAETRIHG